MQPIPGKLSIENDAILKSSLAFIKSKTWRMNNLYRIVDKDGDSVRFRLNEVQSDVLEKMHKRNLILKARQLGMSTFAVLYLLDEAIFKPNLSAGIVSYSLEHAQHIFKRIIGHALDTLTPFAKSLVGISQRSAREITFANGSYLRVDTTLRGGAYQVVLVSEFGKTCARNPIKAEEVITGTLQTVSKDGTIIIESTGEGNSGYYAEMVQLAAQRGNESLSDLEYKLFFYPWFLETAYVLEKEGSLSISTDQADYFAKMEKDCSMTLSIGQKRWYCHQQSVLGEKIKQEFPSSISEAFTSSSDAYYFQLCIEKAFQDNRCLSTSLYDALQPVYIAMDIGVNDLTVICFFQVQHGEIKVIDYYEDKNKGLDFYARYLQQDKHYVYHTIFLPHDAAHRDGIVVENTYERDFKRLFSASATRFVVLKRTDKNLNISNAKLKFDRCVFSISRVKKLLDQVGKYRKKWSEQNGKYLDEPLHDVSSNYADAFIYAMQAVSHIEAAGGNRGAFEKHRLVVENRAQRF